VSCAKTGGPIRTRLKVERQSSGSKDKFSLFGYDVADLEWTPTFGACKYTGLTAS